LGDGRIDQSQQMACWNALFELEKVKQLALIACLPLHHGPPRFLLPSPDGISVRGASRAFSTASVVSGRMTSGSFCASMRQTSARRSSGRSLTRNRNRTSVRQQSPYRACVPGGEPLQLAGSRIVHHALAQRADGGISTHGELLLSEVAKTSIFPQDGSN